MTLLQRDSAPGHWEGWHLCFGNTGQALGRILPAFMDLKGDGGEEETINNSPQRGTLA